MATLTGSFQSKELSRIVSFSAIIPTVEKTIYESNQVEPQAEEGLRTLYLLHGWNGDHQDWIHNTRIIELANKYNIAVILPSGENSFYIDHPNQNNYGKFIGKELIDVTRQLFNLSHKKEDTFISGLSMGGYGSLRNGLFYNQVFGKIAAFSSRIFVKNDPYHDLSEDNDIHFRERAIIESDSFADLPEEMDIYQLAKRAEEMPEIFIACGTEDHLYEENYALHQFLAENSILHDYYESSGEHNWDFWNEYIEKAIEWLAEK